MLQKKAKGERPKYFADPAIEKVLSITLALAGEVAVLRDRLDTVERLSADGKPISPKAIDNYEPDADVRSERDIWREKFLDVVLHVVHQDAENLQRKADTQPYEAAVKSAETE